MAGKVLWMMKMWFASSVRPRSWARQGKPPSVAPERQPRLERMGVLGPARADVAASAASSRPPAAEARRRFRKLLVRQTSVFDKNSGIMISRCGLVSEPGWERHGGPI